MSIEVGGYNFEGPFGSTRGLKNKSGVYAILGRDSVDDYWRVVDIGESKYVRHRVKNHDRKDCWRERGYTNLSCAACYCGEITRRVIEKDLRDIFEPPCGER